MCGPGHGDVRRVDAQRADAVQVVDRDPLDEFHGDDPRRRVFLVDHRDVRRRVGRELDAAALDGPALGREVQLAPQHPLELAGQRDGPIRRQHREVTFQELGQVLDDVQVGLDHLGDAGPANLQGHRPAVAQDRAMDLRDRSRGDRRRVERREDLGGRPAVLLTQDLLDLFESERAHRRAQCRELGDVRLGEQIGPGAQELTQLHEGRSQVLQDQPQPTGPILGRDPGTQRDPLDRPNQPLQVQGGHDILVAVTHQGRQDLPVTRQVAEMADRFANHATSPRPIQIGRSRPS